MAAPFTPLTSVSFSFNATGSTASRMVWIVRSVVVSLRATTYGLLPKCICSENRLDGCLRTSGSCNKIW